MLDKINKDKRASSQESGFTIIEVLIVLAIAGLIMLIVFLAIPALQRNQRNNARNSEASRIAAAVTECLANKNGVINSCLTNADNSVAIGALQRFDGGVAISNAANPDPTPANNVTNSAVVWFNKQCSPAGDAAVPSTTGTRSFAVLYRLEPNTLRCIAG